MISRGTPCFQMDTSTPDIPINNSVQRVGMGRFDFCLASGFLTRGMGLLFVYFWGEEEEVFCSNEEIDLSNEKRPGCLGYIGDYTTQLCRNYYKM